MLHDTKKQALRRFCYVMAAVLAVISIACLMGATFLRTLSVGAVAGLLLVLVCCMLLQHLVTDRLAGYLATGRRAFLNRLAVVLPFLLVCGVLYVLDALTPEASLLLIIALDAFVPFWDIVHALGKMRRR